MTAGENGLVCIFGDLGVPANINSNWLTTRISQRRAPNTNIRSATLMCATFLDLAYSQTNYNQFLQHKCTRFRPNKYTLRGFIIDLLGPRISFIATYYISNLWIILYPKMSLFYKYIFHPRSDGILGKQHSIYFLHRNRFRQFLSRTQLPPSSALCWRHPLFSFRIKNSTSYLQENLISLEKLFQKWKIKKNIQRCEDKSLVFGWTICPLVHHNQNLFLRKVILDIV